MSEDRVYGLHAVKLLLQKSPRQARRLFALDNRNQRLHQVIALARRQGIPVEHADRAALERLAGSDRHQGCVLELSATARAQPDLGQLLQHIDDRSLFLLLDGVTDPHNLGACLRSADAAGVAAVITPRDRAAGLTPVVRKVAAGAAETVPLIQVTNLVRAIRQLQQAGVWVVGTTGEADESLFGQAFSGPLALVMGAEGEGMRRLTAEHCDYLVKLPMRGSVESLNVSVATGICLYEINRQRGLLQ